MSMKAMSNTEKVTVERSYFEALLRRADFHTSAQLLGRPDPANVSISRVEYDSLLRTANNHEVLRAALIQGGVTEDTLDLLISNASGVDLRKDSGTSINLCNRDAKDGRFAGTQLSHVDLSTGATQGQASAFNLAPGSAPYQNGGSHTHLRVPTLQRQASYGMSSGADENGFDFDEDYDEENNFHVVPGANYLPNTNEKRTLYFSGFSDRTTYRDLLSVIKGGKLLSINLRSERSGTVTFLDGAAEFLAWAKRNDVYIHSKRIEVKWADHQFHLNTHISNKIANGATRNILIRSAVERGLMEPQIRLDMEHIHNLVVIDVKYRSGDAYVSMNSVHNALFARTCMMSRKEYKGCKIEFFPDECDVPLSQPKRTYSRNVSGQSQPVKKKAPITNRFDMLVNPCTKGLNIDGADGSSDEENRTPSDDDSDDETTEAGTRRPGVNLNFLDSEST